MTEPASFNELSWLDPLPLTVRPDAGAPLPHVLHQGNVVDIYFYAVDDAPWDGVPQMVTENMERAVVHLSFANARWSRIGGPNDEGWARGYPLVHRGYSFGHALYAERESPLVPADSALTHYLLALKDETIEVVAESYAEATSHGALSNIAAEREAAGAELLLPRPSSRPPLGARPSAEQPGRPPGWLARALAKRRWRRM